MEVENTRPDPYTIPSPLPISPSLAVRHPHPPSLHPTAASHMSPYLCGVLVLAASCCHSVAYIC